MTATAARGHGLMSRVQQLEDEIPSIERAFLSQTNHSLFFYHAGSTLMFFLLKTPTSIILLLFLFNNFYIGGSFIYLQLPKPATTYSHTCCVAIYLSLLGICKSDSSFCAAFFICLLNVIVMWSKILQVSIGIQIYV